MLQYKTADMSFIRKPKETISKDEDGKILVTTKTEKNDKDYIAHSIISYFKKIEDREKVNPNYMLKQKDINSSMRSILIDWIADVCRHFQLMEETLFITVNVIDKFACSSLYF